MQNVREITGVYFDFPIIVDLDMKVAKLHRMLQPNESETAAVRAVLFIDPAKKIRLINYYPINVGRNKMGSSVPWKSSKYQTNIR